MDSDSTIPCMTATPEIDFLAAADRALHEGVQRALAEHKRMGRSIVVQDPAGRIVEIPPERIEVEEEFLDAPTRPVR